MLKFAGMVILICVNPCFDKVITLARLTPGAFHRAKGVSLYASGKAVNSAALLSRLGADVRLTGALPEEDAPRFLGALKRQAPALSVRMFPVPGEMRENIKLAQDNQHGVTEINVPGCALAPELSEPLLDHVVAEARGCAYAMISGSVPCGLPDDFYARLIAALGARGVRCLLDASGAVFRSGVQAKPFLIKPNEEELSALTGLDCGSEREVLCAARAALQMGAQSVLASRGSEGAVYVDASTALRVPCVPITARYTVGAGDSLSAGLLMALDKALPLREALITAAVTAAASVMRGVYETDAEQYRTAARLAEGLEVYPID